MALIWFSYSFPEHLGKNIFIQKYNVVWQICFKFALLVFLPVDDPPVLATPSHAHMCEAMLNVTELWKWECLEWDR